MEELERIVPADDGGLVATRGFSYQAKIAFPSCLELGLGNSVVAVYVEHHQDIVVERVDGVLFLQVKTRATGRPWNHATLLADPVKSLFITYQKTKHLPGSIYVLALEGLASPLSPLVKFLRTPGGDPPAELVGDVHQALKKILCDPKLQKNETADYLKRLRLRDNLPSASAIDGKNHALLRSHGRGITSEITDAVYAAVLSEIERAMLGEADADAWHLALHDPKAATLPAAGKKVTKEAIQGKLGVFLNKPISRFLRRYNDADLPPMTTLEGKLIRGGATPEIIRDAKELRANASLHDAVLLGGVNPDAGTDLLQRLRIRFNATHGSHVGDEKPAVGIWAELLDIPPAIWKQLDQQNLLGADPMLLVGRICGLADECLVDFGEVRHA